MTALAPLYRSTALRRLEMQAINADPTRSLMALAGAAAAHWAIELIGGSGRNVLVLAGPGNNGGDAMEAAAELKRGFYRVDVVYPGERDKLRGEARAAMEKWDAVDGRLLRDIPVSTHYDLVIDGLFGIGLKQAIAAPYAALIDKANRIDAPRLALDLPSGLDADTGAVNGIALHASHTLSFIARKPGLYTLDGPDYCGELRIDSLGVNPHADIIDGALLDASLLGALPLHRARNFHKGQAGALAVIGGMYGMVGASVLAARAALKLGAGKVFLGLLTEHPPYVDYANPELMLRKAEAALNEETLRAVVAGPGMGTDSLAQRVLSAALRTDKALLLDADALNLVAAYGVLQSALTSRKAPTLLTPHPAEAARLLEKQTTDIQADRIAAAQALAQKFDAHVLIKGNGSVCANPAGNWWINASGNPGMASGGMGDVLSGLIGALLAQGCAAEQALLAGVYLHGAAADALVAQGIGPIGLTASEVIDAARRLLNQALAA